jgi:hypothetical protein
MQRSLHWLTRKKWLLNRLPKEYKSVLNAKEIFEFNTALANQVESLNEKLKEERVEVATALQGRRSVILKKPSASMTVFFL